MSAMQHYSRDTLLQLFQAFGCEAPFCNPQHEAASERRPPQAKLVQEVRSREPEAYYAGEVNRLLLTSTRNDIFLRSIVYTLCKNAAMMSTATSRVISEYAPGSSSRSYAMWRDAENRLKQQVEASPEYAMLKDALRQRAAWQAGASQHLLAGAPCGSPRHPRSVVSGVVDPVSTPCTSIEKTEFAVDVHLKLHQVDAQLADTAQQNMNDRVATAQAALAVCPASLRLSRFIEKRDTILKRFGVAAAERLMKQAEFDESARSKVDGAHTELLTLSTGMERVAAIVQRNLRAVRTHSSTSNMVAESRSPLLTDALRQLLDGSDDVWKTFFYASVRGVWSETHEAFFPGTAGDLHAANSDQGVCSGKPKRMSTLSITADFISAAETENYQRRSFHAKCVEHRCPHFIVVSSVKYKYDNNAGELDVVVAELLSESVVAVVEVKTSPADLIKADFQKQRLVHLLTASAASAASSSFMFTAAGKMVEYLPGDTSVEVDEGRKRPRNGDVLRVHEGTTGQQSGSSERLASEAPPSCHVVRFGTAAFDLAFQCFPNMFFVFATTLVDSTVRSPYLSSFAHLVLRELTNELATALGPLAGALFARCADDDTTDAELAGCEVAEQLHALVCREMLHDEDRRHAWCMRMDARRINSSLQTSWRAEIEKSSSSGKPSKTQRRGSNLSESSPISSSLTMTVETRSVPMLRSPRELWLELESNSFENAILL